ncbi:MAG: SDR family oxidoreductase [Clostridia bacterium]|nr:SDR family oxidoreductase [Clostridia bacterium]
MMRSSGGESKLKTCVITGIGSGIGRAVAEELSKRGYYESYALLGRNVEAIQDTIGLMKKNGAERILFYEIDLTDFGKLQNAIQDLVQKGHEITALYNIAGYTDPQPLLSTSIESFELTYKVNVFAPFLLMRECAKHMRNNGGKIMNVASTSGMTPRPGWLSYASSKASVIAMSQTLTAELAEYGIKVYCVSPGRCATKLRARLAPDEDPSTIMQPEEVAHVICNLMDPEECCLDGQNIVIRKQIN